VTQSREKQIANRAERAHGCSDARSRVGSWLFCEKSGHMTVRSRRISIALVDLADALRIDASMLDD
jgi:hypothetical protein